MSEIRVHVHGSNETYDLEIQRFDQLLSEVAKKENVEDEKSIELRVDNTVIDQDIDLATIDNAHVDVKITLPDIGEQC